ncbi:glycosyltransferase family 39 protein [Caldisphaera lagunensis]|uniref:glycosyltransferase family 39 protein n=1 Tax=Caldisphaera lagunensis TaxID=200415 RepID=UPI001FDFC065|nr:glycosyltransferase family 39 protein [Caldisphaera lagunensis]
MNLNTEKLKRISFIIGFIITIGFSYMVGISAYHIATTTNGGGYNNSYISDEIYYVDSARRILVNVFGYKGATYPYSGETLSTYYNFEHPPLAKYIIALSMALLGDKPINWRIPSILMASLIPLIIYLGISIKNDIKWIFLGTIAAMISSSDHILIVMGSVALLDIYAAFFLTIAIVMAFRKRLLLSAVFVGLSAASKETGLFGVLALIILIFALYGKKAEALRKIGEVILIILAVILVVYIPLFYHFGVLNILQQTIGGLKWDLQSRPPGPPTSSPSGWLFNVDPFILSYSPLLEASTTPVIEVPAMISAISIFITCLLYKREYCCNVGSVFYVSIFLGFWLVYLSGNRTLYSFYSVILTPAAAFTLIEALNLIIGGKNGKAENNNSSI